jgi:microcompartment protein CcmK/EutM
MNLAVVKGTAICTIKYPGTEGIKLLVVQPVNKYLEPVGAMVVAADSVRAGVGDLCVTVRQREATFALPERNIVPIDFTLVGIVDQLDIRPEESSNLVIKRGYNPYN